MTRGRFSLCDVWSNHYLLLGEYRIWLLQKLSAVWKAFEEWVLHKEKDQIVELLDQGDSFIVGPFLEETAEWNCTTAISQI
jgi:hypothetical protein